jgi:anti-sigma-K factor RskA
MNVNRASGPECREIRQLLGVYVVGAIDSAERSLVDEHLTSCQSCRDELAGLAGLPAMLSRVPAADVARLGQAVIGLPEQVEPSPELLNSLLRRVAVRRRTRMWRGVVAVAAAAVIAAGGTTAVFNLTGSGQNGASTEIASGVNAADHVAALVNYAPTGWGTDMRVQVTGIKPGTTCRFWIITGNGRSAAGSWTVVATGYRQNHWYHTSSPVNAASVLGFLITAGGKTLVIIHAS